MGTLGLVLLAGLQPSGLCLPGARPHLGVRLRPLIGHAGQSSLSACRPRVAPARISVIPEYKDWVDASLKGVEIAGTDYNPLVEKTEGK